MLITSKSNILSTQYEKRCCVPHRVLQSSKKIQVCVFLLAKEPNYALDDSNAARLRGREIAKVNKTHKFMEGKMKKILFIFLILGILCSSYGLSFAISSEPVYRGNPEEYLSTELTKLGFGGLTFSKDASGKDLYAVSAATFNADSADYKNVIKDVRTTAQKNKPINFKARLQFDAGAKNPYIVVQTQEFKNFGFEILTPVQNSFKFQ